MPPSRRSFATREIAGRIDYSSGDLRASGYFLANNFIMGVLMSFDPFQQPSGGAPGPNPYHSPMAQGPASIRGTHSFEDLKQLAQFQRWMIGMVGAQLLFGCGGIMALGVIANAVAAPGQPPPPWTGILGLLWWGLMILVGGGTIVSLALVGNKVWGAAGAVICALLGFVPCVSLITLLVVNSSATSILQRHGYTVGFLGCNDPRLLS